MIKYVIASHSGFANGLKTTLNFLTNNLKEITAITAYDDEQPSDLAIDDVATLVEHPDTKIIFMTDINTGSVSQKIVPLVLSNPNVHLITGINVPLALSILLAPEDSITDEALAKLCNDQQAAPQLITSKFLQSQSDDDDE